MKFSLPYINQNLSFWNELSKKYRKNIWEIYFPIRDQVITSGRPKQQYSNIYTFLENSDLPKTVLVNPIILLQPAKQLEENILNELQELNQYYGINKATVTDLSLCKAIKENLAEYSVCASTLMRINMPEQILYLQNYIDEISLDTTITRDLKKIDHLRKNFSGIFKLIVNEGCLPGCIFRTQHFYEMGCDLPYPESLCQKLIEKVPWLTLKSAWVLPQHLHFYDGLYDVIKLAGRVTLQDPKMYLKVFQAYLERKSLPPNEIGCGPAGLKEDIPISDEFFYKTITCDKNCSKCDFCRKYFETYL